jgi:outer membrane protein TolC
LPRAVAGLIDVNELPEVRAALSGEAVAAAEANLARAEYGPDLMVDLSYLHAGGAGDFPAFQLSHPIEPQQHYSDQISLQLETTLPVFRASRQGPRYAAKEKELDAARSRREEAQRKQMAEVQEMVAEWDSHRGEAMRIKDELIPLAVQKREAALAAYRGGTGTLDAVLEARRGELRAQLKLIQHEQLAGNAWAWLEYVFPVAEQ